jgi:peptidyl-prolyl cis-trans isomerase C
MPKTSAIRIGAALLALQLLGASVAPAQAQTRATDETAAPRRVVATVNGEPIRARQVDAAAEADRKRRYLGNDLTVAEWGFLKRRALERLVGRELLYQAAKRKHMKVSRRVLDEQLAAARPEFATDEVYKLYLEQAGLTEAEIRRQAEYRLLSEAYAKGITDSVEVTEADARKAHEEDRGRFAGEEQVRCAHIVMLVPADATSDEREAARAGIETVRQRALAGEDFAELARQYSQSPFAEKGGDLGYISRGRMRPEFDAVVFETAVGGVTPVFDTAYGFNLVKVLERREASLPSFDEVKASLLMHLARQRKREQLQNHVRELWNVATVEVLDPDLEGVSAAGF